jgi:hypothetical protein
MPDGSPNNNAQSVPIAANTWYCIEFHLSRSSGQIETWVNGAAVPALTTPQSRWGSSYKPNPSNWGLGWESYGGDANTSAFLNHFRKQVRVKLMPFASAVWFDDIALGTTRLGC